MNRRHRSWNRAWGWALLLAGCGGSIVEPAPTPPAPPPGPLSPSVRGESLVGGVPLPAAPAEAQSAGAVVLQGVPTIDPALASRLERYLETRSAGLNAVSDDGRAILITTRFGQTEQVHVVRAPLGARQQLTFTREPARNASFVPGSSDVLLYMSDIGGNEQYQIFRLDLKTSRTELLTDGKSRHGEYVWSDDGKRLAYTSNARNGKDMDLYVGDGVSASAGTLLLEREGHWYPIEWSRDARKLLVGEYVSINDSRLYVVDVASKAVVRISPEQPAASYRAAAFDPSGNRVYAASDWGGEFVGLYAIDVAAIAANPACAGAPSNPPSAATPASAAPVPPSTGAPGTPSAAPGAPPAARPTPKAAGRPCLTPLTSEVRWNVEDVALSPDGSTLAFVVNEDGYGVLRLLNTATQAVRVAPGVPKGIISGLRFARRTGALGFTVASSTETGDAFMYDVRTGKLARWTDSEMGGLNRDALVEPTLIRYKSFDGREIPAFYYKPKGAGPHPVVINIHGGPEAQARPYFSPLTQYLVRESGVAVLVPNVRGSDGYGKSYLMLDNGMKREDSVKDIGALLDWVGAQGDLAKERVAVLGGSYGGYMVLASLVHYPERLVAGVDVVGISNFVTFLEHTMAYRRDLRRAEYGDERDPAMREFLKRISPVSQADKIRSALFVAHGANDPRVPVGETDQIVDAVRRSGQDVWYMVAKNEGHGFAKKENRDLFNQLAVLFLEKHLRVAPTAPPAP